MHRTDSGVEGGQGQSSESVAGAALLFGLSLLGGGLFVALELLSKWFAGN